MEERKNEPTALVPQEGSRALVPATEDALGYWGKNARRLRAFSRVLLLVMVVFLIVFTVLNAHAFSPLSLYYFGQDLKSLPTQVKTSAETLYYDFGGEGAAVVAYRGGAAVIGTEELSPVDQLYMKFGEKFESSVIAQGEFEERTIEQSLEIGWDALRILPRNELLRVSEEELNQHYSTLGK